MEKILLCALLFSCTAASPDLIPKPRIAENVERVLNEDYRLQSTINTISYDIILQVPLAALDGGNTDFSGQVKIVFNFMTPILDRILIHSLVNIASVNLFSNSGDTSTPVSITFTPNVTTEITTIFPDNGALPNTTTYTLDIIYNGNLETVDMQGFYRSQYTVSSTNGILTEYLGTTQFQPTHARRVFPCFDEPRFKATFNLSITHPTEFTAIANTPVASNVSSSEPGYSITSFTETPKMSTYLLAFTISKFTCSQSTGTPTYGVCSRTDLDSQRALALEYGDKLMDALDTWTNLNYSTMGIEKVDQIAIPDFSAGAMENWGMVTYREYLLLSDEAHTSNAHKQRIITIIAHEFAHMWFGNLITTEWWDTLFLNEGFATYFEYLLLTQLAELQSYEMHKQFITDVHQNALASDASSSSPSLTSEAWSPSQIWSKFNTISYDKGGSIIRMVENVIGSDNFQASLRQYIFDNQFQTSTPAILWASFNTYLGNVNIAANISFVDFVDNWTNLPGYPVVSATLNGTNIILTQNRFLYNGTDNTEWYVPIYYKSLNSEVINSIWLRPDNNPVTIENVNITDNMVIINVNSSAFFRVNYDSTLRQRIISTLESNHLLITDVDRSQILDDIFSLARARYIEYSEALHALNYLRSETSYYPWLSAIRGLNFLSLRLGNDTELGQHLNNKILQLLEIVSANISTTNWNNTEHVTGKKFQMLWNAACRAGQQSCISESRRLFAEFKTSGTIIHPNIRNVVYCNALRHSNDVTDWDFLWNRLQTVVDPHETIFILSTIGCTRDTNQLVNLLSETINASSVIRIQDFNTVWSSVYTSSSVGLQVAFEFFTFNHIDILTYNPGATSLLSAITSRFTSTAEILQLEEFTNQLEGTTIIGTSATAALNSARQNLEWHQSIEDNLRTYFNDNTSTDTTGTGTTGTGATGTGSTASPNPTTESSSATLKVSVSVPFTFVILVKLFL